VVIFSIFLELLRVPGYSVDQLPGEEVSWHLQIFTFHDLKVVGLHGFLQLVEHLGVDFALFIHGLVISE
jgi:hypothetical protein